MARTKRSAGEGTVYKDAAGRWCASVELGVINGKRRRKKVYGKTRKEVADKLKALHIQQQQGIPIITEQITVAAFLDTWLTQVVAVNNKPRTHASYSDIVRLHITPRIGHHQLTKLTPAHVQAMLNDLTKSGLSARTVAYARAVLRRALTVALRWEYVTRNVAMLVDPPRQCRHTITPLTSGQARALLATVKGHRLEVLYHLALTLGPRRGELLALRWEDINLTEGTLAITGTLQWVNGVLERATPKTLRSARTMPLPPVLVDLLKQHQQRQESERQAPDWREHGYVFPSTIGTPLNPFNLLRHFKHALKRAELPTTTRFHDLRHSCASWLVAQDVHPRIIMEILGHSSISVTMNTYAHVVPESQRQATALLTILLRPDTEKAHDG